MDVVADGWALLSQEMIAESINCINCYLKKHCSFPRGYLLNGFSLIHMLPFQVQVVDVGVL